MAVVVRFWGWLLVIPVPDKRKGLKGTGQLR